MTQQGARLVEDIAVGDLVTTAFGRAAAKCSGIANGWLRFWLPNRAISRSDRPLAASAITTICCLSPQHGVYLPLSGAAAGCFPRPKPEHWALLTRPQIGFGNQLALSLSTEALP
ncbi:hypothetical protein [Cypionkella sp. TWP1-2-1b2]|uniref:hypothetical protein n=1 Tax=Cypionkella sp. TWP1-2-1b2 TaxID=2804675 RepID=UPI003CF85051